MAGLMGEFEFFTGTMTETRDLRIKVTQDFEVIHGACGFETRPYGVPEVAVMIGTWCMWAGKLPEMSGWLGEMVKGRIAAENDWGITTEDMTDAIAEDAEHADFIRNHVVGF